MTAHVVLAVFWCRWSRGVGSRGCEGAHHVPLHHRLLHDARLVDVVERSEEGLVPGAQSLRRIGRSTKEPQNGGHRTHFRIQSDLGNDVRGEIARVLAARWRLLGLRSESLSLEEIFLKLTGGSGERS